MDNQENITYISTIPSEARFVAYIIHGTKTTIQKTLRNDGESHPNMVPKTRKDIISQTPPSLLTYAVELQNSKNQFSPYLYLIKVQWAIKDIMDTFNAIDNNEWYNIQADFKQSLASKALAWTGLSHYVMVKVSDNEDDK